MTGPITWLHCGLSPRRPKGEPGKIAGLWQLTAQATVHTSLRYVMLITMREYSLLLWRRCIALLACHAHIKHAASFEFDYQHSAVVLHACEVLSDTQGPTLAPLKCSPSRLCQCDMTHSTSIDAT